MLKNRLEAFSDGVFAIIITIMVLELKIPHGADFAALASLAPVFLSYILSFIYVGIYWNNHHHFLHAARGTSGTSGAAMWANLYLLFWLSLLPFATGWMGENHFAALPVAFYGAILGMCAVAFSLLTLILKRQDGPDSPLAIAMGRDFKGKLSVLLYTAAIPLCFLNRVLALGIYIIAAIMWLIPDRRIEKRAAPITLPE